MSWQSRRLLATGWGNDAAQPLVSADALRSAALAAEPQAIGRWTFGRLMAEVTPMQLRYMDKALETQLALWTALISIQGLFLAVAPILAILVPRPTLVVPGIVVTCLIAGGLLVWNFVAARGTFLKIGQTLTEVRAPSADDRKQAADLFREVRTREKVVLWLLVLQVVLVVSVSMMVAYR